MAPEAHCAQVLPDTDFGSKQVTYPTKLINFLPKCTADAPEPHWAPLFGRLDPRVKVGVQPHQIAIRDITYNFDFMNLPFIVSDHGSRRTWGPRSFWIRIWGP